MSRSIASSLSRLPTTRASSFSTVSRVSLRSSSLALSSPAHRKGEGQGSYPRPVSGRANSSCCYRRSTFLAAENSEVFLPLVSMAVAVILPFRTFKAGLKVKVTLPLPSVLTPVWPMNFWPSLPEALEKNCTRKLVLGVLFSLPVMVVPFLEVFAQVRTGKFCRVLGPVSVSSESLGVTPSKSRSMPSLVGDVPPLEKMELPARRLPVPFEEMFTPSPRLNAWCEL